MAVITISRETGSGGSEIARLLAERLGLRLLDRPGLEALLPGYGLDEHELLDIGNLPENPDEWARSELKLYLELVNSCISDLGERENLILLGRGGQCLFGQSEGAIHIRVVTPEEQRVARIVANEGLVEEAARAQIARRDRFRTSYVRRVFGKDPADPLLYDLVLRRDRLDIEACVRLAVQAFGQRSLRILPPRRAVLPQGVPGPQRRPRDEQVRAFVNESEEAFARLLDFYHIRWEYEPTTFPLTWNDEGLVSEAFSPDFYLVDYDTYIELTTLRQSLVTKKNRKIRRLKEMYPGVKVRIFYRKDYEQLLMKYGLIEEEEKERKEGRGTKKRSPK